MNEKQSLSVIDESVLAEWSAVAPQTTTKRKYNKIVVCNTETIKDEQGNKMINPDFGKLFAEKEGERTLLDIKEAEFFPALIRTQVNAPFDIVTKLSDFFVLETDDLNFIQVFDSKTKKIVDEGNYFDLRVKYQLKTTKVIYVYLGEDCYRWKLAVGGYEIADKLIEMIKKEKTPVLFKVKSITEKEGSSNSYNELDFEISKKITNKEEIYGYIEKVKKVKELLKKYYTEKEEEVTVYATPEEYVEAKKEKPKQTAIKVQDLPF